STKVRQQVTSCLTFVELEMAPRCVDTNTCVNTSSLSSTCSRHSPPSTESTSSRLSRHRACRRAVTTGLECTHGSWWARQTIVCRDRKSTRLNSSHVKISYAVFCLKKKKQD